MTVFYFVRHGEPDYSSVGEWAEIPFGKEFAGLTEQGLHEWESDRTHTVREDSELLRLCQDFDLHNGIYPEGVEKQWESRQIVRTRVLEVLEKYLAYDRVVVSGHAIMMQAVTGEYKPFAYGEILQKTWEDIPETLQ